MPKFLILFICLIQLTVLGQIEEVRRITQTLCSPEYHGRGYVNKGDSIASVFIASEFKKLGLKPLKKSYFQSFELGVNTFPGKMEITMGDKTLTAGIHYLVAPESNGFQGTCKPKLIPVSIALSQELLVKEINQIKSGSAHNCLAFNFTGLSADTLKLLAGLTDQVAEIVPVIEVTNSKFMWSVGRTQYKNAFIQVQDSIFEDGKEWKIQIESRYISHYQSQNVVAYLPSKTKRAKTLVFTAHYDHLGRMGTNTYFPGGNDNASGTAMLISMAKYFREHPSDCNILFIAFAGEEAGLVGSKYFVEHPLMKLKKISFLVNLDIMGSGEEGITVVNATNYEKEFLELHKINEDNQLLAQVKKRGPTQNSDHYWFTTKGVPAFFIYTMGPNKNYHDIFDKYEALSFNEYEDITTLLVKFVEGF